MTEVSRAAPPRATPVRAAVPARGEPAPDDVRAMRDALAGARGRMPPAEQAVGREGKAGVPLKGKPVANKAAAGAPERAATDERPIAVPERRQERRDQFEGFALPGQANAPAPLPMPVMPSPQAHPGAFAQMLADLWTRENGKGSKEVTVRFGERAWPATGARLVRDAAGVLDVTLFVGGRGDGLGDLSDLEAALAEAGVTLGALEVEAA
ncbi:hypothetical protein CKY28_13070 [Sphingomonas lenta]|uniref:Uncharacterized protein n=2 Tax=Sphingomonas lenta TaxID=1141887 RepID=A0A2A2SCS0_9SPHN|nr:hypothetical protein CKY28_13070 [Sphingomonas lenta]